jgi:hypothetical protein
MTAPFFFKSETAGLMFVEHRWRRWRCLSFWFAREDAAADHQSGHRREENSKLQKLHRWCSPSPDHHYESLYAGWSLKSSVSISFAAMQRSFCFQESAS